jgi:hypothetical protein
MPSSKIRFVTGSRLCSSFPTPISSGKPENLVQSPFGDTYRAFEAESTLNE